jgi:hypothetical protein
MNSNSNYNDVFTQLQDYILTDKKMADSTKLCLDVRHERKKLRKPNYNKKQICLSRVKKIRSSGAST